jgi:spore maturation protein SpmA
MLNYFWLALVLLAVVLGGLDGRFKELTDAAFTSAKSAVMEIALPLAGIMALWLGVMRLAERAGMVRSLARALRPVMRRLFPDVPADHPAMGAMLMNMAANLLGLANAATPLGLRAMNDLESLNLHPGTATNAMCTFLAINTASIQLLPATAISIMAAAGGKNPTAIVGTTVLASACAVTVGVTAAKTLEKLPCFRVTETVAEKRNAPPTAAPDPVTPEAKPLPAWGWPALVLLLVLFGFFFARLTQTGAATGQPFFLRGVNAVSLLAIPFLFAFFPLYAALRGVKVYEEFVEGAKEGFQVAVRIMPFLVAMLVAIGMFRAAGGVNLLARALQPVLDVIHFPTDLLPMALTRPLSGSATIGLFADLVKSHGPDSLVTRMGGTLLGSTETTFYVLAVYFGAVAVQRTRHAVAVGLLADLTGMIAAVTICRLVFGGAW